MAKTFYTLKETLAKLGCDEAKLRSYVAGGRIREFRDGGKVNYRAEEVEKLAEALASSLSPEDSGELGELSLADSGELSLADSGEISLSDSGEEQAVEDVDTPINLGDSDTGLISLEDSGETPTILEDSGAATELDDSTQVPLLDDSGEQGTSQEESKAGSGVLSLDDSGAGSGLIGLEDSGDALSLDEVDKDAVSGMKKDDTVITNIGISVFDDDDLEIAADPMAKTLMTGGEEDLRLDGSGGGSGLLDLTRESDDTSLGAELLEGIDMGDSGEAVAQPAAEEEEPIEEEGLPEVGAEPAWGAGTAVQVVGMVEPVSPAFTGLLVAATLSLALLGALAVANSMASWPGYLAAMGERFYIVLASMVGAGGVFAGIGHLVGQQSSRPKSAKKPKAKKGKKKAAEAEPEPLEGLDEELPEIPDLD